MAQKRYSDAQLVLLGDFNALYDILECIDIF